MQPSTSSEFDRRKVGGVPSPSAGFSPGLSSPDRETARVLWANTQPRLQGCPVICSNKKSRGSCAMAGQHLHRAGIWVAPCPLWLQHGHCGSRPHILTGPLLRWEAGRYQGGQRLSEETLCPRSPLANFCFPLACPGYMPSP